MERKIEKPWLYNLEAGGRHYVEHAYETLVAHVGAVAAAAAAVAAADTEYETEQV